MTIKLNENLLEEGLWWLPEKPDDQVAGTLTFSPEGGAILSLIGSFGSPSSIFKNEGPETFTIHGVMKKGRPITLLKAFRSKSQFNMSGLTLENYVANTIALGIHFRDEEEDVFETSCLHIDSLEQWFSHQPFTFHHNVKESEFSLEINKTKVSPLAAFGDYVIETGSSLLTSTPSETEFNVSLTRNIIIRSAEPRSLNWHFAAGAKFQELVSLCTGHFLPMTSFQFWMDVPQTGRAKPIPVEIDILFQRQNSETGHRPKYERPLVTAEELFASNPEAIEHWFSEFENLSSAIHLFFAVAGNRKGFMNVRFLLAIQALEVFHRRTSNARIVDESTFAGLQRELIEGIPANASKKMREKLNGLYQYANEPSLMQRLRMILKEIEDNFEECPAGFSGNFARSLVDTRNYNTHFTQELERKALDGAGMHWASRRIILLLTVLLLLRLGIAPTQIKASLDRHREFRTLWNTSGDPHW